MGKTNSNTFNFDSELQDYEIEILNKFIDSYRHQNIIIADSYFVDFDLVPLSYKEILFKTEKEHWKRVGFSKQIFDGKNQFVVELSLNKSSRGSLLDQNDQCLCIDYLRIKSNDDIHYITLSTNDNIKNNILSNILTVFDEHKIISPSDAYAKSMYTNKSLNYFIHNHDWSRIEQGLDEAPELAKSLFIIDEKKTLPNNYEASFGTILYQLVSYRANNYYRMSENDLQKIDDVITKIIDSPILKVKLVEQINSADQNIFSPTKSILLENNNYSGRRHGSLQYNMDDNTLVNEDLKFDKLSHLLVKKR